MSKHNSFKFVDLFAGLGGFHQAATSIGGQCVFACEIDPGLRELYQRNFSILPEGDIKQISIPKIPHHDVLFAGFPCQPFSKAGKQLGWKDAVRGTLFSDIIKILEHHRPKLVLLENVAHFVRHDAGNTYAKVQTALESLGYTVTSRQLSPHQFDVPHIRNRMYLVAIRESFSEFRWPEIKLTASNLTIFNILEKQPAGAVPISKQVKECLDVWQEFLETLPADCKMPSFPIWSMEFGATYPITRKNLAGYSSKEIASFRGSFGCSLRGMKKSEQMMALPSYTRGDHDVLPQWKKSFIQQNRDFYKLHKDVLSTWLPKIRRFPPSLQKFEWNCQGAERNLWKLIIQFRASGVRVKRPTTSPSLVAMTTTQIPIIGWEQRYMTVKECARLQSMDNLQNLPSGIAAMSALGNAVNVTVVGEVLRNMLATQLPPN